MKPIYCFNKLVIASLLIFCSAISSAQLPSGYISEQVQSGYSAIMGVVFSNDGSKMFVWEKRGHVYVSNWDGNQYVKQTQPVLDISDEVGDWRDFGFASFCLDPNFDSNGLVYMFYMVDREHLMNFGTPSYNPNDNDYYEASISRVTRYKLNLGSSPLTTDYNSRAVLLGESKTTGIPLLHESHAGGTILFGKDGTLLVSTGDNASYNVVDAGNINHTYYQQALNDGILRPDENIGAFRSQKLNSLCGKILRLDPVTGDGVPSNPFYDSNNPRSAESRVWALGFRNPFRMAIKPDSGSTNPAVGDPGVLFVADVGWGTWEDLHIIDKAGLNAGWPMYEGLTKHNGYFNQGLSLTNPDEGNQSYTSLCPQPTSFVDNSDVTLRRFVHNRPEVAWKHGTNDARVPWFSGSSAQDLQVGASGSPTTGNMFAGNTGVAGVYVSGNKMGEAYQGRFLFTDYISNWIQSATLTDGTLNWISDISQLASSNFGSGIVHMNQHPVNGYIYFANIFDGSLRRIVNTNPLKVSDNAIEQVKIYPNPALNEIAFYGLKSNAIATFYSITGKELQSITVKNNEAISLNFSAGIYLIKITSEEGETTKKLILK